ISPLDPMYIAGRKRTASIPPRTLMSSAVYSPLPFPAAARLDLSFSLSFALAAACGSFVATGTPVGMAQIRVSFGAGFEVPKGAQVTEISIVYGILRQLFIVSQGELSGYR